MPSERTRSQPTAPPRLPPLTLAWATLAWALLLGSCGDDGIPTRYEVAARRPTWTAPVATAERPPLAHTWTFETPEPLADEDTAAGPWRPGAACTAEVADGRLVLTGPGPLLLRGPFDFSVDPEIHHTLVLRLSVRNVDALSVEWRAAHDRFIPEQRTSAMTLTGDGSEQTYALRLSTFRGVREARDAEEGVELFRLRFRGTRGGSPRVEVDSLALLSDFDDPAGGAFTAGRYHRGGVYRDAVALGVPGAITTTLTPRSASDVFRLALAAIGASAPIDVVLSSGTASTSIRVEPGRPWQGAQLAIQGETAAPVTLQATGPDGVLLVGSALHLTPQRRPRPDVVLYVEDTLRADHLGTYGYGPPTDPHLQAIAAEGVVFENAFAPSSWTRPSMSSLMTSLVPRAHGNRHHTRQVPAALVTLAESMADQGYLTAAFVTNYHAGLWAGLDQGFDIHHEPRAHGASRLASTLTSASIHQPMADLLAEHADVASFVFGHSLDPHAPYEPTTEALRPLLAALDDRPPADQAPTRDRTRWADDTLQYDAEIRHNDGQLARLDEALTALGLRDDTLLLFLSDHGEAFAEHGFWEHRKSLHQEQVSVPLVMRWPAGLPGGRRLDDPISLVDVAPTVLGLLDLLPAETWQGRDLSARLRDADAPAPRPAPLLLDVIYDESHPAPGEEVGVVLYPYKLVARVTDGLATPVSLFHLTDDPGENANLADHPEHAERIGAMLSAAQDMIDAGPRVPADGQAAEMDPAMREWMVQMGYLDR